MRKENGHLNHQVSVIPRLASQMKHVARAFLPAQIPKLPKGVSENLGMFLHVRAGRIARVTGIFIGGSKITKSFFLGVLAVTSSMLFPVPLTFDWKGNLQ